MPPAALFARRATSLIIVLALLVAAGAVAIVALVVANSTASCVNTTLGARAPITSSDTRAHVEFAQAQAAFATGLKTFTAQLEKGPPSPLAVSNLSRLSSRYKDAADDYSSLLARNQQARVAHPLGTC